MAWFDRPGSNYPRRWNEYSLDFRLFFVWEGALMAATALSGRQIIRLGASSLFSIFAMLGLALFVTAMLNRNRYAWRWPRLTTSDIVKTVGITVLGMIFLFVFLQGPWPQTETTGPMIAFAASIVAFNALNGLELVQLSQSDFEQACGDKATPASGEPGTDKPVDPQWKRLVRGAYFLLFVIVWLQGLAFSYVHDRYIREGTLKPTPQRSQSINEHGTLIYLTAEQKRTDDIFQTVMIVAIPIVLLGGFVLHFVAGVKMFSNLPPSGGWFGRDGTD